MGIGIGFFWKILSFRTPIVATWSKWLVGGLVVMGSWPRAAGCYAAASTKTSEQPEDASTGLDDELLCSEILRNGAMKKKNRHPRKLTECPIKRDYFNRKYIETNHPFSGAMLNFQGVPESGKTNRKIPSKPKMFEDDFHCFPRWDMLVPWRVVVEGI